MVARGDRLHQLLRISIVVPPTGIPRFTIPVRYTITPKLLTRASVTHPTHLFPSCNILYAALFIRQQQVPLAARVVSRAAYTSAPADVGRCRHCRDSPCSLGLGGRGDLWVARPGRPRMHNNFAACPAPRAVDSPARRSRKKPCAFTLGLTYGGPARPACHLAVFQRFPVAFARRSLFGQCRDARWLRREGYRTVTA